MQGPQQTRRLRLVRSAVAVAMIVFCCLVATYLYFISTVTAAFTPKVSAATFKDRRSAGEKDNTNIVSVAPPNTISKQLRPVAPAPSNLDYFVELSLCSGDGSPSGTMLIQVF